MKSQDFFKIEPQRRIFCNRTLNLRSIRAIGYDMDYTLIHYNVNEWESCAYEHLKRKLQEVYELPVENLKFDPSLVMQGLVIDTELGNLVKANRFGFIKIASHGTNVLNYEDHRRIYMRDLVDLSSDRFQFLNTKFSISEACMYAQLVDLMDMGKLPKGISYGSLYDMVRKTIHEAHMEGFLKNEIIKNPEKFVQLDENTPQALLDQKASGKKILLITNSEWSYTVEMMKYSFDRFLPDNLSWRDIFDLVVISARKPDFFMHKLPIFEVVNEEGLLKPVLGNLKENSIYLGGNAKKIEDLFGFSGDEILYVGDHIFADVHVSKNILRWRTALVVRELEDESEALQKFQNKQTALSALMAEKAIMERDLYWVKLQLLRRKNDTLGEKDENLTVDALTTEEEKLKSHIANLDQTISPLAIEFNKLMNERWGLLMRVGSEKSHFARQVEQYSDIYMSRVSNFLFATPFSYLRSPNSNLPHDAAVSG